MMKKQTSAVTFEDPDSEEPDPTEQEPNHTKQEPNHTKQEQKQTKQEPNCGPERTIEERVQQMCRQGCSNGARLSSYRLNTHLLAKAKTTLWKAAEVRAQVVSNMDACGEERCPMCGQWRDDDVTNNARGRMWMPTCSERLQRPNPYIVYEGGWACDPLENSTRRFHFRSGTIRKYDEDTCEDEF